MKPSFKLDFSLHRVRSNYFVDVCVSLFSTSYMHKVFCSCAMETRLKMNDTVHELEQW